MSTDRSLPEAGQLEGLHLQSSLYRDVPPAGGDSTPGNGNFHLQRRDIPQYLHLRSPPSWLVAQHTGPERGDKNVKFQPEFIRGGKINTGSDVKLTRSICSKVDGAAMVAGASSMIFWCLLWMEQSRPNREMAFPYSSARI